MASIAPIRDEHRIPVDTLGGVIVPTGEYDQKKFRLVIEALRSGKSVRIKALGSSMLPSIWPGDILLIESTSAKQFATGDIVVIQISSGLLIHRLVSKGTYFTIRGDAMPHADPRVRPEDVLGKVTEICRRTRVRTPKPRLGPVQQLTAFVLCHSQLLLNLSLRLHDVWNHCADSAGTLQGISASE